MGNCIIRIVVHCVALVFLTGCASSYRTLDIGSKIMQSHEINSVPFYAQTGNSCGIQAARMLADYWNVTLTGLDLSKDSEIEKQGSQVKEIVSILEKSELKVNLVHLSPGELGDLIEANVPVVAVVNINGVLDFPHPFLKKSFWGHTFVVYGFNDETRKIKTHFPDEPDVWLDYDIFFDYWSDTRFMALISWRG